MPNIISDTAEQNLQGGMRIGSLSLDGTAGAGGNRFISVKPNQTKTVVLNIIRCRQGFAVCGPIGNLSNDLIAAPEQATLT